MLTLLLLATTIVAPRADRVPPDSVTAADIKTAYGALVQLVAMAPPGSMDTVIALGVVAPPAKSLLSGFYRDHSLWLSYLITNGRGFVFRDLEDIAPGVGRAKPGHESLSTLRAKFVAQLVADSMFNHLVVPAVAAHLRQEGRRVAANLRSSARITIPMDTAIGLAVRFFYPDFIMEGSIATHVCTVINAVRQLPTRNPALEATAFSAIMRDIKLGDSSRLEADFGPARRLMNRLLPAGGSDTTRIQRAQGVMWGLMARSGRLREVLQAEAMRTRDIVPFALGR